MPEVILRQIALPRESADPDPPAIDAGEYARRCDELRARAGTSWVAVYGDREHSANLLFLTGFDPRFEEALLLLGPRDKRVLLVGNEGVVHAAVAQLPLEIALYQGFSLMSQPRGEAPSLERALASAGLVIGDRVGIVGWKYFSAAETENPERPAWVPVAIVSTIKAVTDREPADVTAVMMEPGLGLRAQNGADQIAAFAWGALRASQAVFRVIEAVRPGMSERDAAAAMGYAGEPMTMHPIVASGAPGEAINGLRSPTARTIQLGDGMSCAIGYWGGLCARAGIVEDAVGIEFFSRYVRPYFLAQAAWYATVGIGVTGGEVAAAVDNALAGADATFRSMLNPGHLTSYDEWVHSPIAPESKVPLTSGMVLQCDIIPTPLPPGTALNCEDTVALADETLRGEIAARHPALWARIERNRELMQRQLGLMLRPETLPLSLANGYLPPGWFSPEVVCSLSTAHD